MITDKMITLTYKSIGNLNLEIDIRLPPCQSTVPILLWFHGGGLLQGSRKAIAPHMRSASDRHSIAVISADYRLAPQATIDEIMEDVLDCLTYIRETLPSKLGGYEGSLDTSRMAVSGSSAGGYLALLVGLYGEGVKVVLPIYPITNPLGPFFTTPQPHPDGFIPKELVAGYLDPKADVIGYSPENSTRNKMYFYMMQEANLANLLSVAEKNSKYIVSEQILARGRCPPTYIVHGNRDRFVGVEQAYEVVEALKKVGADFEFEEVEGADHLFDKDENVTMDKMYEFVKSRL